MRNKYTFLFCLFFALTVSSRLFAGDGSEANPFTVSEAIKVKDQTKLYWVKGYVIGEIRDYSNNKYFWNHKPPFNGACNWLLADGKDETALSKCIPVQLKTGDVCDTLNLDWNPKFWRKEVMAYGKFDEYYKMPGLKSVQELRILTPYPLEDETIDYVDPEEPVDPVDPEPPINNLPQYIYEDFDRIEREEPNYDIGKELNRFTIQEGWYGQYVTTAKGKIRLGFESSKGWVQTPDANLSANNGNYICSFDAWDFGNAKEHKRINVYVYNGEEHVQTQEVIITDVQNKYTFKGRYGGNNVAFVFSAQQGSKNRFYLDNVNIQTDLSAVSDPFAAYIEDFEDGLKELPVDWLTVYEEGTYIGTNGPWNLVGTKLDEDDSAKKNGRKSVVIRLTENATGDVGYIEMLKDKSNGADEVSFYAANYGSEKGAKLYLTYSIDKGRTWTNVAEDISITSELTQYKYSLQQEGDIRIRIGKQDKTPMRACVDDVKITSYVPDSSIGEEQNESLMRLKYEGGNCYLYTPQIESVNIYSITGVLVSRFTTVDGWNKIELLNEGLFILQTREKSFRLFR